MQKLRMKSSSMGLLKKMPVQGRPAQDADQASRLRLSPEARALKMQVRVPAGCQHRVYVEDVSMLRSVPTFLCSACGVKGTRDLLSHLLCHVAAYFACKTALSRAGCMCLGRVATRHAHLHCCSCTSGSVLGMQNARLLAFIVGLLLQELLLIVLREWTLLYGALLVLLDDFDRADALSWQLLAQVAEQPSLAVLVVASIRPNDGIFAPPGIGQVCLQILQGSLLVL